MVTRNLADWIRDEHEKVQDLADALRRKVAVVPRHNLAGWVTEFQDSFDRFRAHLTKHMALEEHDGYFSAVTVQAFQA